MAVEIDGASKGLLGVFAVFTLGSGLASLIYGIFLLLRYIGIEYSYGVFNLYAISLVLIVAGGLLIITLLLGVIGALRDLSHLRLVTLVLLFLLFITLAVVGVWTMVSFKTGHLQKSIDFEMKSLKDGYKEATGVAKKKADYLHQHHNCCTAYPLYDEKVPYEDLPTTCCTTLNCAVDEMSNEKKYYPNGCADVYFKTKSQTIFQLAILVLAAAGAVLIALAVYAIVSQRARAGYAAVSHGFFD